MIFLQLIPLLLIGAGVFLLPISYQAVIFFLLFLLIILQKKKGFFSLVRQILLTTLIILPLLLIRLAGGHEGREIRLILFSIYSETFSLQLLILLRIWNFTLLSLWFISGLNWKHWKQRSPAFFLVLFQAVEDFQHVSSHFLSLFRLPWDKSRDWLKIIDEAYASCQNQTQDCSEARTEE